MHEFYPASKSSPRLHLDECIHPDACMLLKAAGHDVTHTNDLGLNGATDQEQLAHCDREGRVLVTFDQLMPQHQLEWSPGTPVLLLKNTRRKRMSPQETADEVFAAMDEVSLALEPLRSVSEEETRRKLNRRLKNRRRKKHRRERERVAREKRESSPATEESLMDNSARWTLQNRSRSFAPCRFR